MRKFFILLLAFAVSSCSFLREPSANPHVSSNPNRSIPANKFEPYDHFTNQRTWPDRELDWQAYHQMIEKTHEKEAALRGANPCTGNLPKWAFQGPMNVGGRVNSLVFKPDNENTLLAGFSAGGIFKTTDRGDTWKPVFDDHLNLSIGDLTFDPSHPNVVFAGTGDPNMPGIVFNGSGIFKSTNAGETWSYLGLAQAGIISKVEINPTNSNILFAAAMGNPYIRGSERGIYKSTDGGQTWRNVLFVSNQAGASDLILNPQNPNILYASFWDRIRSANESLFFGENAKIFKSTDGGETWSQLTTGLPGGKNGRTGLAMSKQNPEKLYALFVDSTSSKVSIFKTTDGGTAWAPVAAASALQQSMGNFGWYFGKIRLSPTNDEDVYFPAIILWRKPPGASSTFGAFGGMHADVHDFLITPSGTKYTGTDGGVYRNNVGTSTWTRLNLPTTQFYHVNYNHWKPNDFYGGSQDNGITTGNGQNLTNWQYLVAGDGMTTQFHNTDSKTVWAMTQNGLLWTSTDGTINWSTGNTCLGSNDRCGWDVPFFVSQNPPDNPAMYSATFRVHQSDANGIPSWVPISPDLTDGPGNDPRFHIITCIGESPKVAEKLMAGTSDGNVWRREPGGQWVNITSSLPERYVTSVKMSPTQNNRLFVTHSGWRNNEPFPHIHRSDNNGQTWVNISGDLPNFPVNDLFVLPGASDSILFAATDVGVFFTKNGGQIWDRLGSELPNVPVFDLEHNPQKKWLIAATYARGAYTFPLDSIFKQKEFATVNLSGEIKNENAQSIENVQVMTSETDSAGLFAAENLAGCATYELTPSRTDNPLNGVTSLDLLAISKHILGVEPIDSPFKMLAADVNNSKSITTFDIVLIRKLILGVDTAFASVPSWRFVPSDYVFQHPENPFLDAVPESKTITVVKNSVSNLNFTGYKMGDLNASAIPNFDSPNDERGGENYPISLIDKQFRTGETVVAEFSGEVVGETALQFALKFDPETLTFQTLESSAPEISMENFGLHKSQEGCLTACFEFLNESRPQTLKTPFFKIVFTAKKDGRLSKTLNIAENSTQIGNTKPAKVTPALAYQNGQKAGQPVLKFESENAGFQTKAIVLPSIFDQNPPVLHIFSNTESPAFLKIFAENGQLVFEKTLKVFPGENQFSLPGEIWKTQGGYFYQVEMLGEKFSGKALKQSKN